MFTLTFDFETYFLIILMLLALTIGIKDGIKDARKEAAIKRNKQDGTWEIPHSKLLELLEYCADYGVVNIDSEQNYKRSLEFVKKILISEHVPENQHNKYLNKRRIRRYFNSMRRSDYWADSLVARKARACYEECRKANALPPFTTATRQKATLIAGNYFKDFDLEPILEEGERLVNAEQYAKKLEKQNQEREKQKELVKYGNLHGREKNLAILADKYRIAKQKMDECEDALRTLQNNGGSLFQKESSWSVAGGIADALAGPAAGVATAIDVQKKNADIRAYNKSVASNLGIALAYSEREFNRWKWDVNVYNNLYTKAKTLLIDEDMSKESCFKKLKFDKLDIGISDVGTAEISVHINVDPFTIFDDREAVIDGSLIAHIFDGDTKVGEALMVFPYYDYGMRRKGCDVSGMALFCCQKDKKYRVEFSPNDLWAIESLH